MNDLSGGQYCINKKISFKNYVKGPDLFDYSDAHIVVKGTIDLLTAVVNKNDKAVKELAFNNDASFRSFMSKTNNT